MRIPGQGADFQGHPYAPSVGALQEEGMEAVQHGIHHQHLSILILLQVWPCWHTAEVWQGGCRGVRGPVWGSGSAHCAQTKLCGATSRLLCTHSVLHMWRVASLGAAVQSGSLGEDGAWGKHATPRPTAWPYQAGASHIHSCPSQPCQQYMQVAGHAGRQPRQHHLAEVVGLASSVPGT